MNISPVSFNQVSLGARKAEITRLASSAENQRYSDAFNRMAKSPIFDALSEDIDEYTFRSGLEDYQTETSIRTKREIFEDMMKKTVAAEEPAKKAAKITTETQANSIRKLIEQLKTEKSVNPSEAFLIGGQIKRLQGYLKSYEKSLLKALK